MATEKIFVAELNEEELKMINDYGSYVFQKEVEIANDAYGYNDVKRWMAGSAASTLRDPVLRSRFYRAA